MRCREPRPVLPGAHVRIVSPASPIDPEKLVRGRRLLEEAGYHVSLGAHALDRDYYLAGNDQDRASDLMEAFLDSKVDAVWCSRGGYGCSRILGLLDLDAMALSGKMFLGFSDVTILHLALNRRGLATVHAPMTISFSIDREPWVWQSFLAALQGQAQPRVPAAKCLVPGVAEGNLTGGCLCLITDSLATKEAFDGADQIVLIEDVDEHPHRIDAMLTHLLNSCLLGRAKGLVIGEMTRTDETSDPTVGAKPWKEIVAERLAPLGLPTVVGYPFGHMANMQSLLLGVPYILDATNGTLVRSKFE